MQEKYEQAIASVAEMEKRVVMAESMLEATLQYQSGQLKAQPSPRCVVNFAKCQTFLKPPRSSIFLLTIIFHHSLELYLVIFTLIYAWVGLIYSNGIE